MKTEFTSNHFFPYKQERPGQGEMMARIENAVRKGKNVCVEAPNGFGKTAVTLAATLPWIKENNGIILYCARTHRQLDRVMEELKEIEKREGVSGVSFRGRRHMCVNPFVLENAGFVSSLGDVCAQLKTSKRCAYYENLKKSGGGMELLEKLPSSVLKAPEIVEFAARNELCPYELAKSLAQVVDVISLSYLYVFSPFVREAFLPELDKPVSRMVLIQDEAHNVPSTALDSASDSLTIGIVRQAIREASTYNDTKSKKFCRGLAETILSLSAGMKDYDEISVKPKAIYKTAVDNADLGEKEQILMHMRDLGMNIRKGLLQAGKFPRSTIHRVAVFMMNWLKYIERDNYAFLMESDITRNKSRKVSLELVALDPTAVTSPILRLVRSSVAISGTLSPIDAYSEMLGFGSDSKNLTYYNPFAKENRKGIIVEGVETSYRLRSKEMFKRIVAHCVAIAHATPTNTGIFTTSYGLIKELLSAGLEGKINKKLFVEERGLKGSENDILVEEFKDRAENGGAVLLGVQGGRNSEGGDFPGATMESVVVVGVPYAKPTPRIESLIDYYDKRFNGKGRDYGYVLPAMTRAIQAAGRPVRKLDDKGIIAFLDQRFATGYLKRFMPNWLLEVTHTLPDNPDMVEDEVRGFFR
ncbi:MAG: helicase C-terminal domain-containing protein [Candidatus Thorarchaeota archaeon]